ncbi:MAG: TIGR04282 family arsenosugar biosynthesis glycosyltransferase [bacterium]
MGPRNLSRILLVAKSPRPGRVKTRLVPAIGPEEAAALAAAFLSDLAGTLDATGIPWSVALPDDDDPADLLQRLGRDVPWMRQGPGDLGARLARITAAAFERHGGPVAVLGSDHPSIPEAWLRRCVEVAAGDRAAWIPTEDGGYACLALPHDLPGIFAGVPWSTAEVAALTRNRAHACGVHLETIGTWYDVDRPEDLHRLAAEPGLGEHCPATAQILERLGFR